MSDEPPLSGLKVVELARVLAGPWAGQILADLGAEVVKVESPEGDDTRRWGPPFVENSDGSKDAAYFHSTNRNKRSVTANFRTEAGRTLVLDLVRDADVLIENFKVGSLAKFGLDYESLREVNPRLVYCSITGFGQDGPYARCLGYDFIVQGMSGIMDLSGLPDGPPTKIGVAYADIMTGLYAVIGIQAALRQLQPLLHARDHLRGGAPQPRFQFVQALRLLLQAIAGMHPLQSLRQRGIAFLRAFQLVAGGAPQPQFQFVQPLRLLLQPAAGMDPRQALCQRPVTLLRARQPLGIAGIDRPPGVRVGVWYPRRDSNSRRAA